MRIGFGFAEDDAAEERDHTREYEEQERVEETVVEGAVRLQE